MEVDPKYYRNHTTHRTLLQNADDPANNLISCGFLRKEGADCVQRDIRFAYYGGLYVLSGTGVYIDGATGQQYPVSRGCVVQRMPGRLHHTMISQDSNWLEFYFCCGARIFEALAAMNLASEEPVFYAGESQELFSRLLAYQELLEHTDDARSPELIPEFQRLLLYINTCGRAPEQPALLQTVCEKLRQDCRVGRRLEDIAAECGIGYEALRKQFRQAFGCSLSQYRLQLRINAGKTMLLDRQMSVKEVAEELGYCDAYAFCHQFKAQVGVSPQRFRKSK